MLNLQNVSFSYSSTSGIKNINLSISKGENIAIIGESGCGKSTFLKIIYGMYDLNEGQIEYDGKQVLGPKYNLIPGEDQFKYLAQDFDLMPYITVEENIGKFLSNTNKISKEARVNELLEMVEMTQFAKTKVQFLSGGQQQRVAIARVLAREPEVLLLDEPFSQIDTFKKNKLRRNLFQFLKLKQITCLIATHDTNDILAFTDKAIVLQKGEMVSFEETKKLYSTTQNKYVASLFDDVNEIPNYLIEATEDKKSKVLLYPHQLKIAPISDLKVKIHKTFYKGNAFLIEAFFMNQIIYFENSEDLVIGSDVFLELNKKNF
jgi:ABC-type Fe3+/spermidine/putrescine transport system ATPase subunit